MCSRHYVHFLESPDTTSNSILQSYSSYTLWLACGTSAAFATKQPCGFGQIVVSCLHTCGGWLRTWPRSDFESSTPRTSTALIRILQCSAIPIENEICSWGDIRLVGTSNVNWFSLVLSWFSFYWCLIYHKRFFLHSSLRLS